MARADVKTWLSLDEFAQILGFDPLYFNQLKSSTLQRNTVCGDVFFQYAWMHSDRIGREELAMAIQQAEQEISLEAGFNLMPDWTEEERLEYPKPSFVEAVNVRGINARWGYKSVEASKGHLISGGVKTKTLVQAGVTFNRTDADSDGYAELCTATIPTTLTDVNQLRAYYPAKDGEDGWEIRPIKVTLSGGNAIITFKSWQVSAANQMDSMDAEVLEADDANSYETTIDIYRVYNDPSTQAQFLWEQGGGCGSCTTCQLGSQAGCFILRDPRMGMVVPSPGSWNSDTETFDSSEYSMCREPDQIRLWYYSGYRNPSDRRSYAELAAYWKYPIAHFAASKLDKSVCGCSNVQQFIEKWRRDSAFASQEEGGFTVTAEIAANKLGTSMGALDAYRAIHKNGIRVNK